MRTFTIAVVATVFLALAACSTVGTKVEQKDVEGFTKGVTTYQEVVSRLGTPDQVTTDSEGQKSILYFHMENRIKAAGLIPVVGLLFSGGHSESRLAQFKFDRAGRLVDYSMSENVQDVNSGPLGGMAK